MLQTFTYSTGLAFTGRSAACAPATATRPAAEPRRRLFTIFILNLQTLFLERVPYPPSATAPVGTSPCSPLTQNFSHHLCNPYRAAQQGDAPLRRFVTLTEDPLQAMKKRPSHRVSRRFSGECCAKNTQTGAAQKCTRNTDARTNDNCDLSAPYLGIYRHNFRDNFASLRLWVALIALVNLS